MFAPMPPLCKGRGIACGGGIVGWARPIGKRHFFSFTIPQSAPLTVPFTQGSQTGETASGREPFGPVARGARRKEFRLPVFSPALFSPSLTPSVAYGDSGPGGVPGKIRKDFWGIGPSRWSHSGQGIGPSRGSLSGRGIGPSGGSLFPLGRRGGGLSPGAPDRVLI